MSTLTLTDVRPGSTWGAVLRRWFWRTALCLSGGLRVTGALPAGGCVVVANHASHADTAALLAALPSSRRPVAAAAADYWSTTRLRRLAARTLVAVLPVHRGERGAYAGLLEAATPVLRRGHVVVVFPEGTRSTTGEVAEFRSGAVRLARELGVPLVPVALVGTSGLLPKSGGLHPQPVEVRIGAPVRSDDPATLRQAVVDLRCPAVALPVTSRVWRLVARRAAAPALLALSFAWGFAEALSWPVIAEMYLVLWVVALPWRILPAAVAVTLGSVLGVVVHAALARHGLDLPLPLTTDRMSAAAAADLADGATGIWHQAGNGIPVKVYAAEAGHADVPLWSLAWWTLLERGARVLGVAAVLTVLARWLHPLLRRVYGPYLVVVGAVFALLLRQVVQAWS
jgi:1-acyl-sn-glycerol-3-phosphate acyltransferase